jgi:chromosome segregation ATPase
MSKTRTRLRRKFGGTKKRSQALKDCMEQKETLEKSLKDINTVLFSLQSQILEQNNNIESLETKTKEQYQKLKEQNNNIESLETKNKEQDKKLKKQDNRIGNLETDNKYLNKQIGYLQIKDINENIITSLNDINSYNELMNDSNNKTSVKFNKYQLNKLRIKINKLNHFIQTSETPTEAENKIQFIYEKITEIKETKPDIIDYLDRRYDGLITTFLNYLNDLQINYDKNTYKMNKQSYEDWWNHLPAKLN